MSTRKLGSGELTSLEPRGEDRIVDTLASTEDFHFLEIDSNTDVGPKDVERILVTGKKGFLNDAIVDFYMGTMRQAGLNQSGARNF